MPVRMIANQPRENDGEQKCGDKYKKLHGLLKILWEKWIGNRSFGEVLSGLPLRFNSFHYVIAGSSRRAPLSIVQQVAASAIPSDR